MADTQTQPRQMSLSELRLELHKRGYEFTYESLQYHARKGNIPGAKKVLGSYYVPSSAIEKLIGSGDKHA